VKTKVTVKPKFCYCCLKLSSNFCVDRRKKTHYGFCFSCLKEFTYSERREKQMAFVLNTMKSSGMLKLASEM